MRPLREQRRRPGRGPSLVLSCAHPRAVSRPRAFRFHSFLRRPQAR
ncbi:hypothetical protein [Lysobacter gummosus]